MVEMDGWKLGFNDPGVTHLERGFIYINYWLEKDSSLTIQIYHSETKSFEKVQHAKYFDIEKVIALGNTWYNTLQKVCDSRFVYQNYVINYLQSTDKWIIIFNDYGPYYKRFESLEDAVEHINKYL